MDVDYPAQPVRLPAGRTDQPVWIRELCGFDEQAVERPDTRSAVVLLDRVVVEGPGADLLPAADRDRLLAAVFRATYGGRVESTVRCAGCGEPFDVEFSLDELIAAREARTDTPLEPDGSFRLADGRRIRSPTGDDERAVAGLPLEEAAAELLRRAVVEGPTGDAGAVDAALEEVAPLLDAELELTCPECGFAQAATWDIQSYLLSALAQERPQLAREIHVLATAYGWALGEILALPRSRRRAHTELAESHGGASGR